MEEWKHREDLQEKNKVINDLKNKVINVFSILKIKI